MLPIPSRTSNGGPVPGPGLGLPIASRGDSGDVGAGSGPGLGLPIASRGDGGDAVAGVNAPPRIRTRSRTSTQQTAQLLDHYALGGIVGQGAYAAVYSCTLQTANHDATWCEEDDCEEARQRQAWRSAAGAGTTLAVKMVDKVESPVDDIRREVELQKRLDHPNIVRIHEVFFERFFVCIVMDFYCGGDVIAAVLDNGDGISPRSMTHILRQMTDALCAVHRSGIVHRDVKSENYLLDRPRFQDAECRVALADFGTSCELGFGERLKRPVGTKIYWAPEVYDGSYGFKVDVWALGVIVYSVFTGHFPFDEGRPNDSEALELPEDLDPLCQHFVEQLLARDEDSRPDAEASRAHQWLLTPSLAEEEREHAGPVLTRRRTSAAQGRVKAHVTVDERRKELVERLKKANILRTFTTKSVKSVKSMVSRAAPALDGEDGATPVEAFDEASIRVADGSSIRIFEWQTAARVESRLRADTMLQDDGLLDPFSPTASATMLSHLPVDATEFEEAEDCGKGDVLNETTITTQVLARMLSAHGVDASRFGSTSPASPTCDSPSEAALAKLAQELQEGRSRLMLDCSEHKKLVRVVDVLLLRLCYGNTVDESERFLVDISRNRLAGSKKEPHETARMCAQRIVSELDMTDCEVTFDFGYSEVFEEETDSVSYPGMRTVYRKEIIDGRVTTTDPTKLLRVGLCEAGSEGSFAERPFCDAAGRDMTLAWLTEDDCMDRNVQLMGPEEGEYISGLVPAPVNYEEESLRVYLESHGVDVSSFGVGRAKTLQELMAELIRAESSLMRHPDGGVLRVVDVVILKIRHPLYAHSLLVQVTAEEPDGSVLPMWRVPGGKRRPDENPFLAAQRIVWKELRLDPNHVKLDAEAGQVIERKADSISYPGLRTLYRMRVLSGELLRANDSDC
eukprot:TRINITY_DN10531_c0_g1_i1.p1 TRINITY_DN10531_c0_g1~~TRINITY_DN10531_c0_g1_i1.p1  ORF type:complete len:910 (+),score=161.28 TRINITY_DN10531_c0_g1_i1:63-2792(+)